jgi:predicted CoA-substrate-specific enzyme activase
MSIVSKSYKAGLDIGSTTIKIVFLDENRDIAFSGYRRHNADIQAALKEILRDAIKELGNATVEMVVTGSAGMGISEKYDIPFVQEVVAAAAFINTKHPDIRTLIDIGGEDTKMVFFKEGQVPDIRMNGSCAGGTGAFIDQMATLLGIEVGEMSKMATPDAQIYPIASRCGVFSKTDIQNLIARNVNRSSIAASVFHAVAVQTITTLSRGNDPEPKVFFCGGPMAFIPALRHAFIKLLNLKEGEYILTENAELVPAMGCALTPNPDTQAFLLDKLLEHISTPGKSSSRKLQKRLDPLFQNNNEFEQWKIKKNKHHIETVSIENLIENDCFVGIDSGSTTTKIVAIDSNEKVVFRHYSKNNGNPLKAVSEGLSEFLSMAQKAGKNIKIKGSSVTGYGEDLVKAAFNLNYGLVETIAHYTAAHKFSPNVSFILDIGGQDMKAIFVENGAINRLEINEACSSGCGSFIEGFASNLNYTVANFANAACEAQTPCDLGTRCTVFMNSKVKQFLREGASIADISAGLAYSVVKNCLYKVLKLKDVSDLGNHIVVQGGTMRNLAVVRALEQLTEKEVLFTDMPELMGAYGAALYACRIDQRGESIALPVGLDSLSMLNPHDVENFQCTGCENNCILNKFEFENGNTFFSGNKCEKIYSNKGADFIKGENHYHYKYNLLVAKKKTDVTEGLPVIGIPRVLNMYENLPFWNTLLGECGFKVVLSGRSTFTLYERGLGSIMSDNICFPAKLVHGHILDLVHKKVDRILMPYVIFESKEDNNAANSFNCPIVSGYSDVIKSAMNTAEKNNIPIDAPTVVLNNGKLLKKAIFEYLKGFGISKSKVDEAFRAAELAQEEYFSALTANTRKLFDAAVRDDKMIIMLVGRPYHTDPLIQHKISDMITSFGVDVISEDLVRFDTDENFTNMHAVTQWAYTNRIMKAAQFAANSKAKIYFVQMTSFGCGPDAFIIDEVNDVLKNKGKNLSLLKIDDVNNIGSLRLRIRSLIDSLKFAGAEKEYLESGTKHTPLFEVKDRQRKILVPFFSEFYSPFVPVLFKIVGYDFETLPPADELSSEFGLKYSNNEVCFPATLVVGDIIKALNSGKYNRSEIAIAISQTGGQCRATNYIALIKKAMLAAGYDDVPVISLASGDSLLNRQPGFEVKWRKAMKITAFGMLYADCISKMYYSTVPREKTAGGAALLRDKYINEALPFAGNKDVDGLLKLLEKAVADFNNMTEDKNDIARIGIVGEIYVKYNAFGNKNVVNWLVSQNVEVVMPSLANFFLQYFANYKINKKQHIEESGTPQWIVDLLFLLVQRYIKKIERVASKYKYYRPFTNIYTDAKKAEEVVNLAAQFGEGWLIPAEISNFAEEGVFNAVSLQPFGCIANHVIAKGVEKKLKTLFPKMSLLFLDFDSGTSEVNILNRLHFMIKNAQEIAIESEV